MKSVTVVIPNWNGMKFLKICLDSLRLQDTEDFETLVVDNHSEDGSVDFIRERYPEVRLIVHEENLGFTGGVNGWSARLPSASCLKSSLRQSARARPLSRSTRSSASATVQPWPTSIHSSGNDSAS